MSRWVVAILVAAAVLSCHTVEHRLATEQIATRSRPPTWAQTRVVLLGTGTLNAAPDRFGPALAVVVNEQAYLLDCGPGIVRRAAAAHQAGIKALAVDKLTRVFITHFHSDHTLGFADLLLTSWVLERDAPLDAYGPPGLAEMTEYILKAYVQDVRIRIDGLEPANTTGYKVRVHEIAPGLIYQNDNVRVAAFPVRHGSWRHAYGFRFETADRTVIVSGDTAPCESLVQQAKGCDILVHEVYSDAGFKRRSPTWQEYHASFHTSTVALAAIAQQVQPKLLVLTHLLLWGLSPEELLREITRSYKGEMRCGNDLDVY